MHSGLLVFVWLLGVASLQFLNDSSLALALLLSALCAWFIARRRGLRLLRRVRYILVAIIVLFAGFTPGEVVFVDFPRLSPTREGLVLAFEHAARVMIVVMLVAVLLERMPPPRLVGALYALMRPFEAIGFPADRVAIRTLLVLRLVESEKPPRWDHWLSDEGNDLHEPIEIAREAFGSADYAVSIGLALAGVLWMWWGMR